MSIEKMGFNEPCTLSCDTKGCGEWVEFSSFRKAVAFKKKQKEVPYGWRTAKVGDEFKDYCPQCTRKFAMTGSSG